MTEEVKDGGAATQTLPQVVAEIERLKRAELDAYTARDVERIIDAANDYVTFVRANLSQLIEAASLTAAAQDVILERRRQRNSEGWTPDHDDEYEHAELSGAAAAYAIAASTPGAVPALSESMFGCQILPALSDLDLPYKSLWPWPARFWKPKDQRSNLVRAGALILAEIERLDRLSTREAAQ